MANVDVTLSTAEHIEAVLKEAETPVSRQWILDRLRERGQSTTRQRLNRALKWYFDHDMAIEGSKGVQWTRSGSPQLAWALAVGRRV